MGGIMKKFFCFVIPVIVFLLTTTIQVFAARIPRRGANITVQGVEQLSTRKVARRKKGAVVLALDADGNGNQGIFFKRSRQLADFSEALLFLPEDFVQEDPDGARSIALKDEEGNKIVIAAKDGKPVFLKDGQEITISGSQGAKGATGDRGPSGLSGAAGAPGSAGPAGAQGPAGANNDAFDIAANISSNSVGDYTNDDFVFGSPSLIDDTDANHDNRFYFDKSSAAFRTGTVNANSWDSPGLFSVATGSNNTGSGIASYVGGNSSGTQGARSNAFAQGILVNANADNSFVSGLNSTVSGERSALIGQNNTANTTARDNFAAGSSLSLTGNFSSMMFAGASSRSLGGNSLTIGSFVNNDASSSIAIGRGASAIQRMTQNTFRTLGVGFNSTIPTFFVSSASGAGTFSNVGVGNTSPQRSLHITDLMRIEPRATAPSTPVAALGDIYVDSDNGSLCFFDGAIWTAAAGAGPCS